MMESVKNVPMEVSLMEPHALPVLIIAKPVYLLRLAISAKPGIFLITTYVLLVRVRSLDASSVLPQLNVTPVRILS